MFSTKLLRLALFACLLLSVASDLVHYDIAYIDGSGLHYTNTTPSLAKRGIPRRSHGGTKEIVEILQRHHAQDFCSSFLHIIPYAATTTKTSTRTVSSVKTLTATSVSTFDPGTTTTSTTSIVSTTTTTTTTTTATTTTSDTTTITTTTTTATTYDYTPPAALARRSEDCPIPPWLPFPAKQISSACSCIVTPKTKVAGKLVSTTKLLTTTTTTSSTTTLPQRTLTAVTTTTTTGTVSSTEIDSTTTSTTTTTTTTLDAIATQCAMSMPVDGGGIGADGGQLNFYPSDPSPDACCRRCYTTTSCGLWFYFAGFGCFNADNANGPNPNTQCPTGYGRYAVINGTPGDGNVGARGPCGGGLVAP